MQQLSKQMRDGQLKVQDRVKKQVSSVRNLPRVRAPSPMRRQSCHNLETLLWTVIGSTSPEMEFPSCKQCSPATTTSPASL